MFVNPQRLKGWVGLDFSLLKVFLFNFLHGTKIIMKWATESTNSWLQFTTPTRCLPVVLHLESWSLRRHKGDRGELSRLWKKPVGKFHRNQKQTAKLVTSNHGKSTWGKSGWIWEDYLLETVKFQLLEQWKVRAPGCLGVFWGITLPWWDYNKPWNKDP